MYVVVRRHALHCGGGGIQVPFSGAGVTTCGEYGTRKGVAEVVFASASSSPITLHRDGLACC